MLKLKRLKIEKYRSVKPGTELHFRDSLNVLLGRNGTGKTTFLNLIAQLLRWDFSQLREEAVDLEYELWMFKCKLRCRLRSVLIQAPPGLTSTPLQNAVEMAGMGSLERMVALAAPRYSASLEIEAVQQDEERGSLNVEGNVLSIKNGHGELLHAVKTRYDLIGERTQGNIWDEFRLLDSENSDAVTEWMGYLSDSFVPRLRRFDESLEYLEHVTQEATFSARRLQISGGGSQLIISWPEGVSALIHHIRLGLLSDPNADGFELKSGQEGAQFLDRVAKLLDCQSAQFRTQRTSRTSGPNELINFGNNRFDFIRRDGSLVNHTLLSYGQKRLVAFYYYLAANPDLVVADELVNGMHHEWIEACLEDLGGRQSFLTSQNPLLLDYLSFESSDEVQESFVLCRTELNEGQERWVWENMSNADADGFFKAYQVAIQHVSELLRTRGLW